MATLYLDRRDLRLKHEGKAIALYQSGQRSGTVPINLLERVVVRGTLQLDTGLLGELADAGVGVLILSGRHHRQLATLVGRPHQDARRRLAQYQYAADSNWRMIWSCRLIRHKVRAQARLLRRLSQQRPDRRSALHQPLSQLTATSNELAAGKTPVERILGLEGAAAAAYFAALTTVFPPSLQFHSRNRRPPRDPVNACLSLGYTLLHFEATLACHAAGLDPLVGYFHTVHYGRESLAADLIEPLRPRVDAWVWQLFQQRLLRANQFTQNNQGCFLDKAGRQVFYAEYERFIPLLRRGLKRATSRLGQWLANPKNEGR